MNTLDHLEDVSYSYEEQVERGGKILDAVKIVCDQMYELELHYEVGLKCYIFCYESFI